MQDTYNKSSEFKINPGDNEPDAPFREEIDGLRIEKLNQRVTFFSILIPVLIGIIIFFAYLDIKKRVSHVNDTGTDKVQTLSKEMEARISSLSVQHAELEFSVKKDFSSLGKTTSVLKENLNKTTKTIDRISASKADKKKLTEALSSLGKEINDAGHKIKTVGNKFDQETTKLARGLDTTQKDLKRIQKELAALSSNQIKKKEFDLRFENEKKDYHRQLGGVKRDFEDIMNDLQTKTRGLERRLQILESRPIAIPHQIGEIMEQDITE
jgi:chromosome segregation ATPase